MFKRMTLSFMAFITCTCVPPSQRPEGRTLDEGVEVDFDFTEKDPEGCYPEKEMIDAIKLKSPKSKPNRPRWCSENGFLVPPTLSKKSPQTKNPPYRILATSFNQSDTFRVAIETTGSESQILEVIIVVRSLNYTGTWGRFLDGNGVELLCCSYTDKDVARFRQTKRAKQPIFYWVPHETIKDDYEGSFIFQATIAKNPDEYWTNVTSQILHFGHPE